MDDLQHIQRIQRCQNYYMVLQVASNASVQEIETSYRKIVLRVHPDKNHADGANEAFLKVQEARATLTNSIRRGLYDFFMRLREADIRQPDPEPDPEPNSPDDDVFWAGNVPRNRRRNRREANRQRDNMDGFKWKTLGILLLSIMIMGLAWLYMYTAEPPQHSNSLQTNEVPIEDQPQQIFSLTENTKYGIRKRTTAGKISYYVTRDFSSELDEHYGGLLVKLEKDVKKEYKIKLTDACEREQNHKNYWQNNAENPSDKIANSIGTPSCDELEKLFPNDI